MKLYELTSSIAELQSMVDNEEIDPELVADSLEALHMSFEDKVENTIRLMKNFEADMKIIKEEEKRLAARRKRLETSVDNLKNYISENMMLTGKREVKMNLFTCKFAKNPPSVEILNEDVIPTTYINIEEVRKIDKKLILQELKNGQEIDGVVLQQKESLRIK